MMTLKQAQADHEARQNEAEFLKKTKSKKELKDQRDAEMGYSKNITEKQIGGNYYKNFPIQPGEYNQRNRLGSMEGAVVKYVTRHPFKGGKQDLLKAIHNLEMLIELEYPEGEE